jgi:selenocysteine lyase/cysteine desulfurase
MASAGASGAGGVIPSRRTLLAVVAFGAPAGVAAAAAPFTRDGAGEYLLDPAQVYLNTGSVSPTPRVVLDRVAETMLAIEANPVRMTYGAGPIREATDRARELAAAFIGCEVESLQITRSTTEAMNSIAGGMRLEPGDRVLTTDQEHHGGSLCWAYEARRRGVVVDAIPIAPDDQDPQLIVDRFERAMTARTKVVSVSHVITTTGYLMPIPEIAALARSRGALCVVDGAQALGQIPFGVRELGCHAYAASGHKWLMAPKGTGLLYVSPAAADAIQPIQGEDGRRFLSESVGMGCLPLAAGLGLAIEMMQGRGMAPVAARIAVLRELAWRGMSDIPGLTVVSGPAGPRATGLVAARLPDAVDSADFLTALRERHGVIVKMVEKRWFNGIRLSPHIFNAEADVERALAAIRTELG